MKQLFNKYKVYVLWALIILFYLYWTMLPEVVFINGSNHRLEQLKISIIHDDKIWRNIEHGQSKSFRYQVSSEDGDYIVEIIKDDGSRIRSKISGIKKYDFGHKLFIELLPDETIRTDFSYSLFSQ